MCLAQLREQVRNLRREVQSLNDRFDRSSRRVRKLEAALAEALPYLVAHGDVWRKLNALLPAAPEPAQEEYTIQDFESRRDYEAPDEAAIKDARRDYTFRLAEQEHDRCRDCQHVHLGNSPACRLLDIVIANPRRSRCPKHAQGRVDEAAHGRTFHSGDEVLRHYGVDGQGGGRG